MVFNTTFNKEKRGDGAKVGEISGDMTQESVMNAIAGGDHNE